jgi:hypothetical protein
MRIASLGHTVFSVTMIGLGIVGLLYRDFVPVWNPVPANVPHANYSFTSAPSSP